MGITTTYRLYVYNIIGRRGDIVPILEPKMQLKFENLDKSKQKLRAIYKVHSDWFEVLQPKPTKSRNNVDYSIQLKRLQLQPGRWPRMNKDYLCSPYQNPLKGCYCRRDEDAEECEDEPIHELIIALLGDIREIHMAVKISCYNINCDNIP